MFNISDGEWTAFLVIIMVIGWVFFSFVNMVISFVWEHISWV